MDCRSTRRSNDIGRFIPCTANIHNCLVTYDTILTTAIDISLNKSIAGNGNLCILSYSLLRPYWIQSAIEQRDTSHGTTKDITAILGVSNIVTNRTTADVDGDMTVFL